MARSIWSLRLALAFVAFSVVLSQAPKDPLKDFCRRFSHQTAVINRHLYIDGGYVNANPLAQNPRAVANPNVLAQNLDVLENGMPKLSVNYSKNATVPSVSGGIFWTDDVNQIFYLYGGEYPLVPDEFVLWAYDVAFNQWNLTTQPASSSEVLRVAWGAGTTVEGTAEGYYYGGYLNNNTTPGWNAPSMATSSLVKYDMVANTFTNNTGPDSTGRAEGVMVTIPASRQGLLVYFGGVSFPYGNSTEVASPMETIFLYDIAEGKWYQQNTTGQIPENRRKFCAGAVWAEDQSSYNIYLYGGAGFAENATGFDDVYILTLPSFTWIKWYPTEPGPGSPHHSLSCNVINNAQMLVIGGTFPATDACDAPDVWGTHNLDLGKDNPKQVKWNLFNPNLTTYKVPSEIVAVVGGDSTGGATVTAPAAGWDNRDLPVYFQQQATYAARTPTRMIPSATSTAESSTKSSRGAIIGGAVGGVLAALLLAGLAIFFCLRRRRRQSPTDRPDMAHPIQRSPSEPNGGRNSISQSMPSPSPPTTNLPSYIEHKPYPSTSTTLTHSSAPLVPPPSASPIHSYTNTPPPMIGSHHQTQTQPSALDPGPPLFTHFPTPLSPPATTTTYQHPAHSPPFQQQPYFPPPPTREYEYDYGGGATAEGDAASRPHPQSRESHEMPADNSVKFKKKKTWGD